MQEDVEAGFDTAYTKTKTYKESMARLHTLSAQAEVMLGLMDIAEVISLWRMRIDGINNKRSFYQQLGNKNIDGKFPMREVPFIDLSMAERRMIQKALDKVKELRGEILKIPYESWPHKLRKGDF